MAGLSGSPGLRKTTVLISHGLSENEAPAPGSSAVSMIVAGAAVTPFTAASTAHVAGAPTVSHSRSAHSSGPRRRNEETSTEGGALTVGRNAAELSSSAELFPRRVPMIG